MVNDLPGQGEPDDYDIAADFYASWIDALAELRLRRGGGRTLAELADSGRTMPAEARPAEA